MQTHFMKGSPMKSNVGNLDRTLRVLVGIALLSLLYLGEGQLRWLGLIGIVPIATGLMRFCPLYSIFGINTCNRDPG